MFCLRIGSNFSIFYVICRGDEKFNSSPGYDETRAHRGSTECKRTGSVCACVFVKVSISVSYQFASCTCHTSVAHEKFTRIARENRDIRSNQTLWRMFRFTFQTCDCAQWALTMWLTKDTSRKEVSARVQLWRVQFMNSTVHIRFGWPVGAASAFPFAIHNKIKIAIRFVSFVVIQYAPKTIQFVGRCAKTNKQSCYIVSVASLIRNSANWNWNSKKERKKKCENVHSNQFSTLSSIFSQYPRPMYCHSCRGAFISFELPICIFSFFNFYTFLCKWIAKAFRWEPDRPLENVFCLCVCMLARARPSTRIFASKISHWPSKTTIPISREKKNNYEKWNCDSENFNWRGIFHWHASFRSRRAHICKPTIFRAS